MSGRLVAEVLDHAPADLTPAELLVLIALAETARDTDRHARYKSSVDDLARRTRRSRGVVKNALTQLVKAGLIRRVHDRVHKGGVHQEYVLTQLHEHHRDVPVHVARRPNA